MKKLFPIIIALFTFSVSAQMARVQVVHNSADALAATVDVYINGLLALPDVPFRTASPFSDLPAGIPTQVAIAPGNSSSVSDAFYTEIFTLTENETYVIIAEGIASATGYDPAPPFDLIEFDMAREVANDPTMVDLLVHHGSTDAPTVDVFEVGVGLGQVVDNISYGEFQGYFEYPVDDYIIEVRDETGSQLIAAYEGPLATLGLQGAALTVVASGFLDPSQNSNGPEFGLYVVSPLGGPLIPLPPIQLSVNDLDRSEVLLSPNPANDVIRLEGLEDTAMTVEIVNVLGKVVVQSTVSKNANSLNVESLSLGLYILVLSNENGNLQNLKFVKR